MQFHDIIGIKVSLKLCPAIIIVNYSITWYLTTICYLTGLWSIDFVKMQRFLRKRQNLKKTSKPHVDSSSNHSHEVSTDEDSLSDHALRPFVSHYNPNERDRIRRYYLTNGPCQLYNCDPPPMV
jgi:hypothetical protein